MTRKLSQLYVEAQAEFYGPIIDKMDIGPEGITEKEMAELPPFMDMDTFREYLDRKHVPYRL